jgi:hypothetical protein
MGKIMVVVVVFVLLVAAIVVGAYFLYGKPKTTNSLIKTLKYNDIVFTAPNDAAHPFYIYASKNGQKIWEIGADSKPYGSASFSEIKDGITDMYVKNLRQGDLDAGADDYKEISNFVGKPALYIKETSASSPLSSWLIVEPVTGKKLGIIAFN